jgi:hypothetical protein
MLLKFLTYNVLGHCMLKILEAFTVKLRFITLLWVKNTCSHRIPDIHDLGGFLQNDQVVQIIILTINLTI